MNPKLETQNAIKIALVAGAALVLATIGFFWQVLFTPNTWMPAGGGDLVPFLLPNYRFAAESLRQGIIPLWNPHLYSGAPFAADPQSGLFYPINLLVFLLNPNITVQTLEHLAIFHFWLAGFGMFLYLQHSPLAKTVRLHPLAAFAGALAFEFSDLFIVHFGNLNMIAVAVWLPLVMLFFHKSLVECSARCAVTAGAILAIATLAGHMQITLFILLAMGLLAVWEATNAKFKIQRAKFQVQSPKSKVSAPKSRVTFHYSLLALAVLVMTGLAALWLIPTLEMSRFTPRAHLPYAEAAQYSLHPAQLIGLLIPNFFGRDPALHWGPWQRVETGYIGIFTLLAAAMGAWWQKDRHTRFLILLAGISFLLALGDSAILHGWLSLSPGYGQFRAPARYIFLLDFSLAGLAAVGIHRLMTDDRAVLRARLRRWLMPLGWMLGGLTVVGAPLAYFSLLITQDRNPDIFRRAQGAVTGLVIFLLLAGASWLLLVFIRRGRLRSTAIGVVAAALIALDLFSLGANVDVGHSDPTAGFDHPAAIEFLRKNAGINRIEVTTDVWHLWQPDAALLNGLYDGWGLYNPLTLADTTRFWQGIGRRDSAAYRLLGVKYIIAGKGGAPADGDIVPIFADDPAINIYLNRAALPRVLFVSSAQIADSHEKAWELIQQLDFDPEDTVVLENISITPKLETQNLKPETQLAVLKYGAQTVDIGVKNNSAGYMVLSDAWYPGWRATVDGDPAPVLRANYAFRAVPVPAGEHRVQLEFSPLSWKIGLAVSGLTVLGLILLVGYWRLAVRET